jgi:hypothetical protein
MLIVISRSCRNSMTTSYLRTQEQLYTFVISRGHRNSMAALYWICRSIWTSCWLYIFVIPRGCRSSMTSQYFRTKEHPWCQLYTFVISRGRRKSMTARYFRLWTCSKTCVLLPLVPLSFSAEGTVPNLINCLLRRRPRTLVLRVSCSS